MNHLYGALDINSNHTFNFYKIPYFIYINIYIYIYIYRWVQITLGVILQELHIF